MYKTRKTGKKNRMRGVRGMLYFKECCRTFRPSGHQTSFGRPVDVCMKSGLHIDFHWTSKGRLIPTGGGGGGGPQTFRGMLPNIPGNVLKQILGHKFQHLIRGIYKNRRWQILTSISKIRVNCFG